MEELAKMQESLHGIRMKINIADPGYTHPLLHLWKDAGSIQTLIKRSKSGDLTTGQFQIQGERLHASTSVKIEVKSPRREEQMNISAGKPQNIGSACRQFLLFLTREVLTWLVLTQTLTPTS